MAKRVPFFVAARMLLIKGKKVLMGFEPKRYNHPIEHWETPGGHIERGENIISGLLREAKEEIGSKIKIKKQLPFFFSFKGEEIQEEYRGDQGIVIYFICESITRPDIRKATQKEFNKLKFMGKKEFMELKRNGKIMFFDQKYLLKIMKKLKLW